ncbi:hypothetical protein [Paenibacillus sp. BK033]|nr:hypothetical protein [Paenibacillus sp. BK033]
MQPLLPIFFFEQFDSIEKNAAKAGASLLQEIPFTPPPKLTVNERQD